jgi:hypothetical protein
MFKEEFLFGAYSDEVDDYLVNKLLCQNLCSSNFHFRKRKVNLLAYHFLLAPNKKSSQTRGF